MKFAWKIFFTSFIILILSFGIGGFVLVNSVFQTSLNNTVKTACDNNSYITSSFYAVVTNAEVVADNEAYINSVINNFKNQVSLNNSTSKITVGESSDMNFYEESSFINELKTGNRGWKIVSDEEKHYIQVVSRIQIGEKDFYIETLSNISNVYTDRDYYCNVYQTVLLCVVLFSSLVLVIFSLYITRPLVKLSNVSKQIAQGDFTIRANIKKVTMNTQEIYQLSQNFNKMADCTENYIEQLKQEAQSRDDFVADFTHELKTPLTSVIGYADMLRSYELDAQQRRDCADYIYKEGKRLEALSINLLNIIVLKNNDIKLQSVTTDIIFNEIENSVKFLLEKYGLILKIKIEQATISVEPSMFKTMVYNIIDNACKASKSGQTIEIHGFKKSDKFRITIRDFGRGIPKEEIEKITRPFYMIDKSRSRSQGGAGLGLALCQETARLHGTKLVFESKIGEGTTVSFDIKIFER